MKPYPNKDWLEALEGAIESHRADDLGEWELHLIGTRVKAALADNGPTKSEMRKLEETIRQQKLEIRTLRGCAIKRLNCTCGLQ